MERPPTISEALIRYLDRQFPDRCPPLSLSEREVWAATGSRSVVEHLKMLYDEQNQRTLT